MEKKELKNLNNSLASYREINATILCFINRIANEIAINPSNEFASQLGIELNELRKKLEVTNYQLVAGLAPDETKILEQAKKELEIVKLQSLEKEKELQSTEEQNYNLH